MRVIVPCIIMLGVLLSGCATHNTVTPRNKLRQSISHMIWVKKNLSTANCVQIDKAMATSYTYRRVLKDRSIVKKKTTKLKAVNYVFLSYYQDFQKEFKRRCPGTPIYTKAVIKLYPDLIKYAKERARNKERF